jgi:hypothetical protein
MFYISLFVFLSLFFWPLCCLFFFDIRFWLPLWYLQTLLTFDHCVVCSFSIYMNSDYLPLVSSNFSYFWSLCCLFFFDIWILITSLWYLQTLLTFDHCVVCSFSIYEFWLPPFGIFKLFLLSIIVLSVLFRYKNSDYLPLVSSNFSYFWPVLSVFFTIYIILITPLVSSNSSYFWPLCCLFFLDIWILITSL